MNSKCLLTCTIFDISIGNIERGNRSILKSDSETNAVFESKTLFGSDRTNVAKVTKDTWQCER